MMADFISYNECVWNQSAPRVEITEKSGYMTQVPASSSSWVGLENGWYYVQGSVSYKTLHIMGDNVNLVLCDGAQLTCTSGIRLKGNNKLTIYSQSTGSSQGKLVSRQNDYDAAGIGCADNEEDGGNIIGMGTLVVHGGDISATGSKYAAAIGGGKNRGIQGSVTIYGGKVKALKETDTHLKAIYWNGCMMGQLEVMTEMALNAANVYQICRLNRKVVDADGEVIYWRWPATERYSLGISIYANNSPIWVNYKHVYKASAFDQVTGWSKFLDRNQQEIDPQTNPANESSIIPDWM